MAHAGLSAIIDQLRALRVALPIDPCGAHWDQFLKDENFRIPTYREIDLFVTGISGASIAYRE
jgi:hypothetical protein